MGKIEACGHSFEIVSRVPAGYEIWNIGGNMPDGFLPLCQVMPKEEQPFEGGRAIRTDTLMVVKIETAQTILLAASHAGTPAEMEKFLEKHKNAEHGTWVYIISQRMKAALDAMKDLVWE